MPDHPAHTAPTTPPPFLGLSWCPTASQNVREIRRPKQRWPLIPHTLSLLCAIGMVPSQPPHPSAVNRALHTGGRVFVSPSIFHEKVCSSGCRRWQLSRAPHSAPIPPQRPSCTSYTGSTQAPSAPAQQIIPWGDLLRKYPVQDGK